MQQITIIIPFKFIKQGISQFALDILNQYRIGWEMIVRVCADFITEFSHTTTEGLVMPEPLVLVGFIQQEFHSELSTYVMEQSLDVPTSNRIPKKMVLQIVADIAFVMTEELIPVIRQYITSARYPIECVYIQVHGADITAVQLELKYDPRPRHPTYKFCNYPPADIQSVKSQYF